MMSTGLRAKLRAQIKNPEEWRKIDAALTEAESLNIVNISGFDCGDPAVGNPEITLALIQAAIAAAKRLDARPEVKKIEEELAKSKGIEL